MVDQNYILQGLLQRGLPRHVAQGFVMNMQDESGLNPGINEIAPLVPGSRGGFGLYQLTGPRRRAYEAYASQRGVDPANADAQLDFLMTELQGPESRAAQSIFATNDVASAATAIARDFLRPAPENLQKRIAKYSGATGVAGDTMAALGKTQEQPMGLLSMSTMGAAPQEKEKWWNPDRRDSLQLALEGMTLNPNPGIMYGAQARMQGRQEDRRADRAAQEAQKRAARTAEWLQSRGRSDLAEAVAGGFIDPKAAVSEAMKPPADDRTAMIKNYEYAQASGFTGSFQDFLDSGGGGGVSVNLPANAQIAGDYVVVPDPSSETGVRMTVIPGSKTAMQQQQGVAEAAGDRAKSAERDRVQRIQMGTTLENLNLNIGEIENGGLPVTGVVGAVGSMIPGTPQKDFSVRQEQINTRAALDEVQTMRDNSPTGGAVGQLTDSEREAIGIAATSLNQASSSEEYLRAAKRFRETMLNIAYGEGLWAIKDGQIVAKQKGGSDNLPTGVSQSEWDAMTPQERALWQR